MNIHYMKWSSFLPLVFSFTLFFGCGSLDENNEGGGNATAVITIGTPNNVASSSLAKNVEDPFFDDETSSPIAKAAFTTASISTCTITATGATTTSKTFSCSTSGATTTISLNTGTNTICINAFDSSRSANSIEFGYNGCKDQTISSGTNSVSLTPLFLNHVTDSSGICKYLRFAQGSGTQSSIICGLGLAATADQKDSFRLVVEFDATGSASTLGTLDSTQTTGLTTGTKARPYFLITGGAGKPEGFFYTTADAKRFRLNCSWVTNSDGNTEAQCTFGNQQFVGILDSNEQCQFAALASLNDGSSYDKIPNSSTLPFAKCDLSTNTNTSESLAANSASCSTSRSGETCDSGWCPASSCLSLSTVSLNRDVTTFAGCVGSCSGGATNGAAGSAEFNIPEGICASPDGNAIYVMDTTNHLVRKIDLTVASTSASYVTTLAGTTLTSGATNGACASALFNQPAHCVVDSSHSNLYLTEKGGHLVRKIALSSCTVSTIAGSGSNGSTDGTGTAASFDQPLGIAIDSDDATLYVADNINSTIRKIVIGTQVVTTFAGTAGSSGSTNGTGSAARFNLPCGVAIDPTSTNLYIGDSGNGSLRKLVLSTQAVTTTNSTFTTPCGVSVDPTNTNVYVVETVTPSGAVHKVVLSTGVASNVAGNGTGSTEGNGTSASFSGPNTIALNPDGTKIYVVDKDNSKLRLIQ